MTIAETDRYSDKQRRIIENMLVRTGWTIQTGHSEPVPLNVVLGFRNSQLGPGTVFCDVAYNLSETGGVSYTARVRLKPSLNAEGVLFSTTDVSPASALSTARERAKKQLMYLYRSL